MQSDPSGLNAEDEYGQLLTQDVSIGEAELPELGEFSRFALNLFAVVVENVTGVALTPAEYAWVAWGLAALEEFQADLATARAIDNAITHLLQLGASMAGNGGSATGGGAGGSGGGAGGSSGSGSAGGGSSSNDALIDQMYGAGTATSGGKVTLWRAIDNGEYDIMQQAGLPLRFTYGRTDLKFFTNSEENARDFGLGMVNNASTPKPVRILSGTVAVDVLRQPNIYIGQIRGATHTIWEIMFESPQSLDVIHNVRVEATM
jgi:hypothetical protein